MKLTFQEFLDKPPVSCNIGASTPSGVVLVAQQQHPQRNRKAELSSVLSLLEHLPTGGSFEVNCSEEYFSFEVLLCGRCEK